MNYWLIAGIFVGSFITFILTTITFMFFANDIVNSKLKQRLKYKGIELERWI